MAVRLEWAHAEFLGQGQGLAVGGFGRRHVRRVTMHGNLTEEPQGPRLLAPPVVLPGVREHPLCQPVGLLHTPRAEISLPTGDRTEGQAFPSTCPSKARASVARPARA